MRVMKPAFVFAIPFLLGGCFVGVGGAASIAISHEGRVRLEGAVPLRLHTQAHSHRGDTAFFGWKPMVGYRPDSSTWSGGVGFDAGGTYFDGRLGFTGMLTYGVRLDGAFLRIFGRLSFGFELDVLNREVQNPLDPAAVPRAPSEHGFLGAGLALEYAGSARDARETSYSPGEWNFIGSLSFSRFGPW